jgi:hypothetical protein
MLARWNDQRSYRDSGDDRSRIAHLEEINRRFWGDAPGDSEQRQAVFEELWGILDDHYVAFNRLDIDWDAFYEENVEAIGNA